MLTQELRILNAALSMAKEANGTQRPLRHVRPGVVNTIVKRSLAITASLPPSLREHLAIRDLSDFISMSQSNKSAVIRPRNTDLLPIGHPRSSRSHALSLDSMYAYRSRWMASDCSIGSDEARVLVAAAFSAMPNSLEHTYLSARLRALPAGVIPPSVLLAATYSGNNSRAARSARARAQDRDRKGRFAWMGGGMTAFVDRNDGSRRRLTGRLVSQGKYENGNGFFDIEGRDGLIRRVEAKASEGTKGYLESADSSPEGYSPEVAQGGADDYFMKESDIRIVEVPNGFYRDANYTGPGTRYTDDAYEIIKLNVDEIDDNFDMIPGYLTKINAQGKIIFEDDKPVYISRRVGDSSTDNGYQSWADVQEWINKDQNNRDKSEGREPDVLARLTPEQYDDLVENVGDGDPVEYARKQLGLDRGAGTETGKENKDVRPVYTFTKPDGTEIEITAFEEDYKGSGRYAIWKMENGYNQPVSSPRYTNENADKAARQLGDWLAKDNDWKDFEYDPESEDTGEEGDGTEEEEGPRFTYTLPENAYNIDLYEDFVPRDNIDAVSSDYTEDPSELAALFEPEDLRDALEAAILSDGDGPANGMSPLEFLDGQVDSVPAEAIFDAMNIQGFDAEAEVADIYDSQMDGTPNRDALDAYNAKYGGGGDEVKARLEETEGDDETGENSEAASAVELPVDISTWESIPGPTGSNDGGWFRDPATGDRYYVKRPQSDKHASNEALASALYEEAGIRTGRIFLAKDEKGDTILVSPIVEGSNSDFYTTRNDPSILESAQQGFVTDAWLNNWDSVGLVYDNMVTKDGEVYRIDPGASLLFRAQGADKSATLGPEVSQIDSLRDPGINPQAANVFGPMTNEQLIESAKSVMNVSPEKIDELVDAAFANDPETAALLKDRLKARREDIINRFGLTPTGGDTSEEDITEEDTSAPVGNGRPLPALLEGLSDEEKTQFLEDGKYEQYLPQNTEWTSAPEGYYIPDSAPFNVLDTAEFDGLAKDTLEPLNMATSDQFSQQDLQDALLDALSPDSVLPGYGVLSAIDEDGESRLFTVQAEAVRDALQLQGFDTNSFINNAYSDATDDVNAPSNTSRDLKTPEGITTEYRDWLLDGNRDLEKMHLKDLDALRRVITGMSEEEFENSTWGAPDFYLLDFVDLIDENIADRISDPNIPKYSEYVPKSEGTAPETADDTEMDIPSTPHVASVKTSELQAGDVTFGDHFVVESVFSDEESLAAKSDGMWVVGHYPGHESQKTKIWSANTDIKVYRNTDAPAAGTMPALSKPKPREYDPEKKIYKNPDGVWVPKSKEAQKKFFEDLAAYDRALKSATNSWTPPEGLDSFTSTEVTPKITPDAPVGIFTVKGPDLKAGDIAFKKETGKDFYEFFVIQDVVVNDDGTTSVTGYYPGHQSQSKTWQSKTPISVMRGVVDLPALGNGPALDRPKYSDPDYEAKKAAFDEAKRLSSETFTPPIDLTKEESKAPKKPALPTNAAFTGPRMKELLEQAAGDPAKLKELLDNEEVVYFDYETTGDDNWDFPTPIQVAAYKYKNGELVGTYSTFINPESPLGNFYIKQKKKDPSKVLKDSNGDPISDEFLADQISREQANQELIDFIGPDAILVAHNAPFDVNILWNESDNFDQDLSIGGVIDTLGLSRASITAYNHKLQTLAGRYGLDDGTTDWHNAQSDAAVLHGILNGLLDEMKISGNGSDYLDYELGQKLSMEDKAQYESDLAEYEKYKADQATAKLVADAFAKKKDLPTVDDLIDQARVSDIVDPDSVTDTTPVLEGDLNNSKPLIESVLGGAIDNDWVADYDNTENLGPVSVDEWQVGDFFESLYGGFTEVLSVKENPSDPARMLVTGRNLSNGKEYNYNWIRYNAYNTRRRNELLSAGDPAPQGAPTVDADPDADTFISKWNGFDLVKGADGVHYIVDIDSPTVGKFRSGLLTPPALPLYMPLGGGNNRSSGEGYYFDTTGKRRWGKYGAAGVIVRRLNSNGDYEYLLAKRASHLSTGGGKWAYPGGAHKDLHDSLNPTNTAEDEFEEEMGGNIRGLEPYAIHKNHLAPDWSYNTYLYEVGPGQMDDLTTGDGENSELKWFTADEIKAMAISDLLHPDFATSAEDILELSDAAVLITIDDKSTPENVSTSPDSPVGDLPTEAIAEGAIDPFRSAGSGKKSEATSALELPVDISTWVSIPGPTGSNEGGWFVDPATGDRYYVKKPKSDKHAANEALASALYAEAGIRTGRIFLAKDKDGNTVLVSPIVEGSNADFYSTRNDPSVLADAQRGFITDAWLNNWDSVGLVYDNMVTKDGEVYRIDPGAALLFRAQGADKSATLTPEVTQIDSLRDPNVNTQAANVFGPMTNEQLIESAKSVMNVSPEKIDELVDAAFANDPETAALLKDRLKARREDIINRFGLTPTAPEGPSNPQVGDVYVNPKGDRYVIVETTYDKAKVWTVPISMARLDKNGNLGYKFSVSLNNNDFESFLKLLDLKKSEELPNNSEELPNNKVSRVPEVSTSTKERIDSLTGSSSSDDVIDTFSEESNLLWNTDDLEPFPDVIDIASRLDAAIALENSSGPKKLNESEIISSDVDTSSIDDEIDGVNSNISSSAVGKNFNLYNPDAIIQDLNARYPYSSNGDGTWTVWSDSTGNYRIVVEKNKDITFSVIYQMEDPYTGKITNVDKYGTYHSFHALDNRVSVAIDKLDTAINTDNTFASMEAFFYDLSKATYWKVTGKNKADISAISITHPSPDGSTEINIGDRVWHSKKGKFGQVVLKFSVYNVKTIKGEYEYTDYVKIKFDDGTTTNAATTNWVWKIGSDGQIISVPGTAPEHFPLPSPMKGKPSSKKSSGGTPTPTPTPTPTTTPTTFAELSATGVLSDNFSFEMLSYFGMSNFISFTVALEDKYMPIKNGYLTTGMLVEEPTTGRKGVVSKIDLDYTPTASGMELTPAMEVSWLFGEDLGDFTRYEVSDTDSILSLGQYLPAHQALDLFNIEVDTSLQDSMIKKVEADNKAYKDAQQAVQDLIDAETGSDEASRQRAKNLMQSEFSDISQSLVNGPGVAAPTITTPPDWSTAVDGTPSLDSVLVDISEDDRKGAGGATVLVDATQVEDLKIRVSKVRDIIGDVRTRLQFKMTGWAGDSLAISLMNTPMDGVEVETSDKMEVRKFETNYDYNELRREVGRWPSYGSSSYEFVVDSREDGETHSIDLFDDDGKYLGTALFHRALKNGASVPAEGNYYDSPATSHNNKMDIFLAEDATSADIQKALSRLLIDARPASDADVKTVVENKMISLLGKFTDYSRNLTGQGRARMLDLIEARFGLRADDVKPAVIDVNRGTVMYQMPRQIAESIAGKSVNKTLFHRWAYGGSSREFTVDSVIDLIFGNGFSSGMLPTDARMEEGINAYGASSNDDQRTMGSGYMFFYGSPESEEMFKLGSSGSIIMFNPADIIQNLDWYVTAHDDYGARSKTNDNISILETKWEQLMVRDVVPFSLASHVIIPSSIRIALRQRLIDLGITEWHGIPIEKFFGLTN